MTTSDEVLLIVRAIGFFVIASIWAWLLFPSDERAKRTLKSWEEQGYVVQSFPKAFKTTKRWLLIGYFLILSLFISIAILSGYQLARLWYQ